MKPHVRAAAAAIAAAHSLQRNVSSIYDYSQSTYLNISVSINGNTANGYDYTKSCHVSGTLPNIYHYGVSSHLNLRPDGGGRYTGYDYDSSSHFNVTVNGSSIQVYDYEASSYFSYSC